MSKAQLVAYLVAKGLDTKSRLMLLDEKTLETYYKFYAEWDKQQGKAA